MTVIDRFRGEHEFLSNFFRFPVEYEGIVFPTVEHAFQAAKTLDTGERTDIANASTPSIAKAKGRRVGLRPDWERVKIGVMEDILRSKFSDPVLRESLEATGDTMLIEGNTWGDQFWGVADGKGENQLGKALMRVRDEP